MSSRADKDKHGSINNNYDYESLRLILEKKKGKPVSIEEAMRIGDDLIDLYLAFLSPDVEEGRQNSNQSNRGEEKGQADNRTNKKGS